MVRTHRVRVAILAALAVALYANTLGHGYALDDRLVVTHNEFVQAGWSGIPDLLTGDSFRGYLAERGNPVFGGRYRPVSLVTFAIETALFGTSPFAHHAVQVLLYALCCAVLYCVLAELLGERGPSLGPLSLPFAAALLFTVHPLHTEVVANVKSRDEILALLFALVSLWLWLRAAVRPTPGKVIGAAAVFFLALLAKESAITFLAIIPLSLWFFRRPGVSRLVRIAASLAFTAAVYLVLRQINVGDGRAANTELLNDPFLGASRADAYATVFYTWWRYAALLVWPHPLTHDYAPYHIAIQSWRDAGAWLGVVSHLGLTGLALSGVRTRSIPAYAAAFYLAALSVASNLLFPIGTFMGERFLFTPSVGAALGLAWAALAAIERWLPASAMRARVAVASIGLWATALGALTVLRNPAWKDSHTLLTTDISVSSQSALANANVADAFLMRAAEISDPGERARLETEAIAHLETALRIHPRYERALEMLSVAQGRRGDADAGFTTLVRLYELNPRRANLAFNLGTLILEHHPERSAEAVPYLERAVALRPTDADAHANLGVAYYQSGDARRAIVAFERAVALAPANATHRANLEQLRAEVRK